MKTRNRTRSQADAEDSPAQPELRRSSRRRGDADKDLNQALREDKHDREAARVAQSQERQLLRPLLLTCY